MRLCLKKLQGGNHISFFTLINILDSDEFPHVSMNVFDIHLTLRVGYAKSKIFICVHFFQTEYVNLHIVCSI